MGLLFQCFNLSKSFGERNVLNDISFDVEKGETIGIVGKNGSGKTTLSNIIAGKISADKGKILWHQKNVKIGFLNQNGYFGSDEFNDSIFAKSESLGDFFEESSKLGIDTINDWNSLQLDNLSGGEKTKLSIAKIWSEKPELIIFDEPTNHMDYDGIKWLIKEISNCKNTVIIISHDRYFMDEVVEKIIDIEDGKVNCYKGNYSFYTEEKERIRETQIHEYEIQEKYKGKIQSDIYDLKRWSDKGHRESRKKSIENGNRKGGKEYYRAMAKKKDKQVKSRIKKLEKINVEGVEKPKEYRDIEFRFNNENRIGEVILEARDISKNFGEKSLFCGSSFYIKRGEHVALFGKNGCGKTTLIKSIIKESLIDEGDIYITPSAKVGYLGQDNYNIYDYDTVFDCFDIRNFKDQGKINSVLLNMGFEKNIFNKKISDLSYGETIKIRFAQLTLFENSILIFDEPTNHLDLSSREVLEKSLEGYGGTIIVASHDRYFLEKTCDKVLLFEDGKIKRIEYSFKEFINLREKKKEEVNKKFQKNKLMVVENRINEIVGQICYLSKDTEEYKKLDEEYKSLIEQRKILRN